MIRKKFIHIFLFGLLFSFMFEGELFAQFAGGEGTSANPYQVSTLQQLQDIDQHLNAHFELVNDIDATETAFWDNNSGFEPIGSEDAPFKGTFDGNGYEILGLTINRNSEMYIGLFGVTEDAVVKNLRLQDVLIRGSNETGGLIGKMLGGSVQNVHISGEIFGRTHTGGLAGFNRRGRIENSFVINARVSGRSYVGGVTGINRGRIIQVIFEGNATGRGHNLGGIAGNNYDGLISESISKGVVAGKSVSSVGGLAGSNGSRIVRSFSEADVSGRSYVGGLVGNNHNGEILWSYSNGAVEGFNLTGGLAGVNRRNSTIQESYTTSPVKAVVDFGAFIGVNRDPIQAGFWNRDTANQSEAVGKGNEEGITGLRQSEMTGRDSYEAMTGFSFHEVWGFVENEPPKHLWNMPYFIVEDVETADNYISGDEVSISLTFQNVGSLPDTNDVVIRHPNGEEIDRYNNLILRSGQKYRLRFRWQTNADDHGVFYLTAETGMFKRTIPISVARLPDPVDVKRPFVLEEHVDLTPTFRWDPAFLAESYDLQISEDENFSEIKTEITGIDTTFYTLRKPLDHLTYYHWRVRGANADTTGPWGDISEFITIIEKPGMIQLKKPESGTDNASTKPTFEWASASRAEEYQLQISPDEEFETALFDTTIAALDTVFTMETNLPEKQTMYWRMKAHNIGGESKWSEPWNFIPLIPPTEKRDLATLDYTLEQNYPNPFNPTTYIRYSIPEPGRVQLEVLNMLGQTVATLVDDYKSAGWHTAVFDASELSSGFYIYRIKAKNFEETRKLSVVK